MKHVTDEEGKTYVIPEHILEDFEVVPGRPVEPPTPTGRPWPTPRPWPRPWPWPEPGPDIPMGGYAELGDPWILVRQVLERFVRTAQVSLTINELRTVLEIDPIGPRGPGRPEPGPDPFGGRPGRGPIGGYRDVTPVDPWIQVLQDERLAGLKLSVSLADVADVLRGIDRTRGRRW